MCTKNTNLSASACGEEGEEDVCVIRKGEKAPLPVRVCAVRGGVTGGGVLPIPLMRRAMFMESESKGAADRSRVRGEPVR